MPTIKDYNQKLHSLKNTEKITKTMKMVSASKLHKAQEAQVNAKKYAEQLRHMTSRIAASVEDHDHPLLQPYLQPRKALILVLTSDKGLAGSFNHNAHKAVLRWIEKNPERFEQIDISCCGKRGYQFFRKLYTIHNYYQQATAQPDFEQAKAIGEDLIGDYINNLYDEIFIVYNQFLSPLSQKTIFEQIIPIDPLTLMGEDQPAYPSDYIFEPDAQRLIEYLIPHYLFFKIYFALLENAAGEHGARMTAMDNATNNANDLIDNYTLLRNRARQAAITTELTEIVAGAEALQ